MHSSLQNITALTVIIAGFIVGGATFHTSLNQYHTQEATHTIIKEMAKECQSIKERERLNDSFEQTSLAVNLMLGQGHSSLSQEAYLELIALCVVTPKTKLKV